MLSQYGNKFDIKFNANEGSMVRYVRRLLVLLRKTKVDFYCIAKPFKLALLRQ